MLSRRQVLQAGMLSVGSLGLADLFRSTAHARSIRRAKHCILMLLNGGQAQHDTFDMKPLAPDSIPWSLSTDFDHGSGNPDL